MSESLIEARIVWQDTLLDVTHFAAGAALPPELMEYEGVESALQELALEAKQVSVGPLSLRIRQVSGEDSAPRKPVEWAVAGYIGVSMLFAGVFLVLMALSPATGSAMSLPDRVLAGRLVPFESTPAAQLDEDWDQPEDRERDEDAGGSEWGSAGSAGVPSSQTSRRRAEREGESPSLRAAPERSGALSLGPMFEGLGSSPSPFEVALAHDFDSLLGNLTGSVVGESFGFGGIAMTGTGRHSGAQGLRSIASPDGLRGMSAGLSASCGCASAARSPGLSVGRPSVLGVTPETRTSGVPRIRSARPEVQGALDPSLIRRVVRRHRNETRHCYEQALQLRPELAGRVQARFVIDPSGSVLGASLQSSTISSARVEDCVLQVVRRMSFPATPGGRTSIVSYPWVFSTL